eukprot:RCo042400
MGDKRLSALPGGLVLGSRGGVRKFLQAGHLNHRQGEGGGHPLVSVPQGLLLGETAQHPTQHRGAGAQLHGHQPRGDGLRSALEVGGVIQADQHGQGQDCVDIPGGRDQLSRQRKLVRSWHGLLQDVLGQHPNPQELLAHPVPDLLNQLPVPLRPHHGQPQLAVPGGVGAVEGLRHGRSQGDRGGQGAGAGEGRALRECLGRPGGGAHHGGVDVDLRGVLHLHGVLVREVGGVVGVRGASQGAHPGNHPRGKAGHLQGIVCQQLHLRDPQGAQDGHCRGVAAEVVGEAQAHVGLVCAEVLLRLQLVRADLVHQSNAPALVTTEVKDQPSAFLRDEAEGLVELEPAVAPPGPQEIPREAFRVHPGDHWGPRGADVPHDQGNVVVPLSVHEDLLRPYSEVLPAALDRDGALRAELHLGLLRRLRNGLR